MINLNSIRLINEFNQLFSVLSNYAISSETFFEINKLVLLDFLLFTLDSLLFKLNENLMNHHLGSVLVNNYFKLTIYMLNLGQQKLSSAQEASNSGDGNPVREVDDTLKNEAENKLLDFLYLHNTNLNTSKMEIIKKLIEQCDISLEYLFGDTHSLNAEFEDNNILLRNKFTSHIFERAHIYSKISLFDFKSSLYLDTNSLFIEKLTNIVLKLFNAENINNNSFNLVYFIYDFGRNYLFDSCLKLNQLALEQPNNELSNAISINNYTVLFKKLISFTHKLFETVINSVEFDQNFNKFLQDNLIDFFFNLFNELLLRINDENMCLKELILTCLCQIVELYSKQFSYSSWKLLFESLSEIKFNIPERSVKKDSSPPISRSSSSSSINTNFEANNNCLSALIDILNAFMSHKDLETYAKGSLQFINCLSYYVRFNLHTSNDLMIKKLSENSEDADDDDEEDVMHFSSKRFEYSHLREIVLLSDSDLFCRKFLNFYDRLFEDLLDAYSTNYFQLNTNTAFKFEQSKLITNACLVDKNNKFSNDLIGEFFKAPNQLYDTMEQERQKDLRDLNKRFDIFFRFHDKSNCLKVIFYLIQSLNVNLFNCYDELNCVAINELIFKLMHDLIDKPSFSLFVAFIFLRILFPIFEMHLNVVENENGDVEENSFIGQLYRNYFEAAENEVNEVEDPLHSSFSFMNRKLIKSKFFLSSFLCKRLDQFYEIINHYIDKYPTETSLIRCLVSNLNFILLKVLALKLTKYDFIIEIRNLNVLEELMNKCLVALDANSSSEDANDDENICSLMINFYSLVNSINLKSINSIVAHKTSFQDYSKFQITADSNLQPSSWQFNIVKSKYFLARNLLFNLSHMNNFHNDFYDELSIDLMPDYQLIDSNDDSGNVDSINLEESLYRNLNLKFSNLF
jgi:hypothetical protein